jgi:hypothetical protein
MRRDIAIGTTIGITFGILSYLYYKKPQLATVKPPCEIDPAVYKKLPPQQIANPAYKHPNKPIVSLGSTPELDTYKAPYNLFGFGRDSARNADTIDIDSYLNMPLESDGITYKNRDKYTSLDETPEIIERSFKYIRFTVLKTRGETETVSVGGFRFLRKDEPIGNLSIWNPHTGEKTDYTADEWNDSDQWCIIFVFPEPVVIHKYQIKTSTLTPEMDPVKWKIEISNNAAYWEEIHTKISVLPFNRSIVTTFGI